MKQYYTAVGEVRVRILNERGHVHNTFKFSHVIEADNADDAQQKLVSYYDHKSYDDYEKYEIIDSDIFDFINQDWIWYILLNLSNSRAISQTSFRSLT